MACVHGVWGRSSPTNTGGDHRAQEPVAGRGLAVCRTCCADDIAGEKAAAEAACAAAAALAELDLDDAQGPGGLCGLFRRRA